MKKLFTLLLTVLFVSALGLAQSPRTVTGTVVSSDDGSPIVGATVTVVGTQLGTMTDLEGNFTFNDVPASAKAIKVSYVGMSTQEVRITGRPLRISLGLNSEMLGEVVVTALGISRNEKTLGYSATSVSAETIEKAQTSNVMSALQGKVAGLQVQTTGSAPGSTNNVSIRGLGSINGSNQPLYVVDGVPLATSSFSGQGNALSTGGVANISPDDIANLTVLKGAAATALYGSRASNGVIMITTKSGKKGESKNYTVSYSGNVEANRVSLLPDMQNRWGQGWNGNQTYIENGSWGPALNGSVQPYGPIWNNSQLLHYYDAKKSNVKDFFDTGVSTTHNVALSGQSADEKMTFYASYGYTSDNGIMPGDHDTFKRNTFAARGSYQPEKWIRVSTSMNLATYNTKAVAQYQGTSVIDGLLELPRDISTQNMRDLSSAFNTPEAYFTPYGITNPYWALDNNYNLTSGKQVFGKMQLDIMPISALTLSYRFGFDYNDYDNKTGYPQIALDDALINEDYGYAPSNMNQDGYVYAYYRRAHELTHDFLAMYQNRFLDERLDINATVGLSLNERASTYLRGESDNLAVASGFWDLSNGSTWSTLDEGQSKRRLVGLFGDVTVGWDDFLYLDVTARNDWSSTLPIGNNSYFYPGVTLSGIFTKFIPSNTVLDFGKIRLAYGKTGNDASPYYTATTFGQAYTNAYYVLDIIKFPLNSQNAFISSSRAGSNNLRPEMTSEFEVGTNLKFFNGRIELDASYYDRRTKDQIFTLPTDPATGYTSQVVNFGEVSNKGVELMLNLVPIRTADWRWDIGFNFAKNYNKVVSLPESLEDGKVSIYSFSAGNDAVYMYAEEGKPLGTFWTYLPVTVTDQNSPYYGSIVVDQYGQPTRTANVEYTGYTMNHKWTGGVTTSLTWKGVTLSAALDVRYGGKMFSRTKNLMQFTGNGVMTEYNSRNPFVIPGSVIDNGDGSYGENTTPIYVSDSSLQNYFNDYGWGHQGLSYLIDRSYAKLRNVSLSWQLPQKWVRAIKFTDIALTAYCNNAFIWTAKGNRFVDPESTTVTQYGDLAYGFGELYSNPSCRSWGLNLKVTF